MAAHTILLLLFTASLLSLPTIPIAAAAAAAVKAVYWFPASGFVVSSIDSTLFTHLFCAFADLNPSTYQVTISSSNAAAFSSFTSTVQQKNPSVATLLSIGGGSANKTAFSTMAANPSSRKSFIDSSIQLARSNNFLGLDLDWEYPSTTAEMTNLGTLLTEWRASISTESSTTGKTALLLTAAFYVSSSINGLSYPVSSVSANLDWVNVMAYDFYSPSWKLTTSAHAALYDSSGGVSASRGVSDWINTGLAPGKIVLGIPFYGYAWKLKDSTKHGLGAAATGPASGSGIAGDGSIGFNGIKAFVSSSGAATVYNATVVVNYCYSGTTWIGYDDVDSVAAKVTYAKGKGLLGYFAWTVSGDNNWVLSSKASSTWG